jgi:SAM-dependent methyltransferase
MASLETQTDWLFPGLSCPYCQQTLVYHTEANHLACSHHGAFAIAAGIPQFAPMTAFDAHWESHADAGIPPSKLAEARHFLDTVTAGWDVPNLTVLDAGCGDGVHGVVLSDRPEMRYVGIDISPAALKLTQSRVRPDFQCIQGDITRLPFADNTFDLVVSFGVIAYTADPIGAFGELCRVCKPEGRIAIWIYPKSAGLSGLAFSMVRQLCQLLGSSGTGLLAHCIVPFLGMLPTRSKMHLGNASWRQCHEVVMVNIQPKQMIFPTQKEVESWFSQNGIRILGHDSDNPITLWGEKGGN